MTLYGSRWVMVGDSDPEIHYEGSWSTDQSNQDIYADGHSLKHGLHRTLSNSNLSYAFSGPDVQICVTKDIATGGHSQSTEPLFDFFLDNIEVVRPEQYYPYPRKPLSFCQAYKMADGAHVITLNSTTNNRQPFWFDLIKYVPSQDVLLDNVLMEYDSSDSIIHYSDGWSRSTNSTWRMTNTPNAKAFIEFYGLSLTWVGTTPSNVDYPNGATYSVDGGPEVNFTLPGLVIPKTPAENGWICFQVSGLSPGHHNITVTYQGLNNSTTPLTLDRLLIQQSPGLQTTSSPAAPSSTSVSSSTSTTDSGMEHRKAINFGPIVGGVLGGVALLVFFLMLLFFTQRSRRRNLAPSTGQIFVRTDKQHQLPMQIQPLPFVSSFSKVTLESSVTTDSNSALSPR